MKKYNKNWFSIIEILVWIFIFTLWITWVYAIISSTLRINDYNENYIIASNLAREQLELVRNIRDSNYSKLKPYNLKNPAWTTYNVEDRFEYNKNYKIENDYSTTSTFPIKVEEIVDFWEWVSEIKGKMLAYRLCLDSENRYTYDCITTWNKETIFYRYIGIDEVKYDNAWVEEIIDDSFLINSKVVWYKKWYHEFEVKSIITDWKRL